MVTREELIGMIEDALEFEEKCVPLLADKCTAVFRELKRTEMIGEDQRKMRRLLNHLVSDTREHRQALERLLREVKEGAQDEF